MTLINNKETSAWEEFSAIYRPFIIILLRSININENEIDDITQTIMLKLWKKLDTFTMDGRAKFRTWLITVIRNAAYSHTKKMTRQKEKEQSFCEEPQNKLLEDEDSFEKHYQNKWEVYLCKLALNNITPKFRGKAIEVFQLTMNGLSIEQISETLKLQQDSIYRLRGRVKMAMIAEVNKLRLQMEG